MSRIRRFLTIVGLLGMLPPVSALAQMVPSRVISSVDIKVLNQGLVALGRVSQARLLQDGSVDFTIRVDETLKGQIQPTLQLHQDRRNSQVSTEQFSRLSLNRTQVLIVGDGIVPLDPGTLAVPTASGLLLREPTKVIDYVRETLRSHPGDNSAKSFRIPLSAQLQNQEISNLFIDGSGLPPRDLVVPVDAQLEKWAVEAIRSNSDPFRGFQALTTFASDANIAFVKTYLNDPTFDGSPANDNNGVEIREHRVRRAAYDLLRIWRVAVDQPVLREEVPQFERLETFAWSGTNADALWPRVIETSKNLKTFSATMIGRPSERELGQIIEIQSLTTVSLAGRDKTDAMLISVGRLRNLEQLNLDRTKVTDTGLNALTSLPHLNSIGLSQTRVTDEGLKILAGIPSLKTITVILTQVTPAGIAEVRSRRPDLQITWERSPQERAGSLHDSVQSGELENVRRLLEAGRGGVVPTRKVDSTDLAGNTPLIYAAGQNQIDIAKLLLDEGARANFQDLGGATPLLWAARHGYPEMVQLLLDRRATINQRDEDGNTALHFAVQKGAVDVLRILVERGAAVRSRNNSGETPLDLANRLGNPQVQETLRSAEAVR